MLNITGYLYYPYNMRHSFLEPRFQLIQRIPACGYTLVDIHTRAYRPQTHTHKSNTYVDMPTERKLHRKNDLVPCLLTVDFQK